MIDRKEFEENKEFRRVQTRSESVTVIIKLIYIITQPIMILIFIVNALRIVSIGPLFRASL